MAFTNVRVNNENVPPNVFRNFWGPFEQGDRKKKISRPHDAYGWMDFDAMQKINFAIPDGLWILISCQIHLFGAPARYFLGKSPGYMG